MLVLTSKVKRPFTELVKFTRKNPSESWKESKRVDVCGRMNDLKLNRNRENHRPLECYIKQGQILLMMSRTYLIFDSENL